MTARISRLRFGAAALCLAFAVALFAGGHRPARAAQDSSTHTDAVAVDRQDYVSETPVDPNDNDTLNIYVSTVGGSETARSFVHLALDGLPPDAKPSGGVLTLTQNEDQSKSVNPSAAIVQACVLTTEMPAKFDKSHPPVPDCSKGSSVGKAGQGGTWAFDLKNLAPFWHDHGNTGAAIVPVAAPGETWSVAFDKARATAQVTWTAAAAAPAPGRAAAPEPQTAPAPATRAKPADNPVAPLVGGPVANPAAAAPTGEAVSPAATATTVLASPAAPPAAPSTGGVRTVAGHRSSTWVWALLAALVAAVVLAGRPIVAVATAGAGRIGAAVNAQLRGHARAIVTSIVLVIWTVTYGVYSVVVSPASHLVGAGQHVTAGPAAGQDVANGAAGDAGAGGPEASGSAANGATGARAGSAGGGTAGGGRAGSTAAGLPADEANLPAAARLFGAADDRIGISDTQIKLCGHAALTFGPAFNIGKNDINVFWQNLNDHGGVWGRKFSVDWQDDSYQPGPAVTAAQMCKDEGTFMLLGGIGFDQIPAVRVWAEQNHELYLHHIAVQRGSEGLRYSFTALPSVEQMGRTFGQLAVQKYRGKKIGILWRNSSNWQPGRDEFRKVVQAAGMQIVGDYPVQNNQGNYNQQIVELKTAGAEVVFAWENALGATEMIRQAKAQSYSPNWLLFPFNLTLQTIGNDALNPPLDGLAAWPAYTAFDHDGPYSSYASDLEEFEREYKQYDPNASLSGPGGDLLFLAWVGFKQLADMFQQCGRDCTRNKFAALMLNGYHKTITPNCDADFSGGDHHHAAPRMDVFTTTNGPGGKPSWVPTQRCISNL